MEKRTQKYQVTYRRQVCKWKQCRFLPLPRSAYHSLHFPSLWLSLRFFRHCGPARWLSKLWISSMLTFLQRLGNWRLQFNSYFRRLLNFFDAFIVFSHATYFLKTVERVKQMCNQSLRWFLDICRRVIFLLALQMWGNSSDPWALSFLELWHSCPISSPHVDFVTKRVNKHMPSRILWLETE